MARGQWGPTPHSRRQGRIVVGGAGHDGPDMDGPGALGSLAGRPAGRRVSRHLPPRPGKRSAWPAGTPGVLIDRLAARGIDAPWSHQAQAAEAARRGEHVVVATGTASGKSLAMWLPSMSALVADDRACVLYLSPTKALAHDQLAAIDALGVPGVRAATYDGDTPTDERAWVRAHANFILTNPDLVHRSLLPRASAWSRVLRHLDYILIDEAHHYRGMFGSHVAMVVRRLRRLAAQHGSDPVVLCASATMSSPGDVAARLIGAPVTPIGDDGSAHAGVTAVLWEPAESAAGGSPGSRRSALVETAGLLSDLASEGRRTLAFVRSRRGAEIVAQRAREELADARPDLAESVAAYRGGYLAEERRSLEADLREGRLRAVATTNALELGIDVSGLDAVVVAGWPGTRASLWQQWGRAGRGEDDALAILIVREDPLDRYVLEHPEVVFDHPVESVVLDPANPHVLGPHLAAAAAEAPLTDDDAIEWFGPTAPARLAALADQGVLRRRPTGYFWTQRHSPSERIDLRGGAGGPVRLVEEGTGRLLGTVEEARAPATVHPGAVYLHQGVGHIVTGLDLDESVAMLRVEELDHTTTAEEIADYRILGVDASVSWGDCEVSIGEVEVTSQVVGFVRRRAGSGEILGREDLDMPARTLRTRGTWWTVSDEKVAGLKAAGVDIGGAAHAAEHAAIGLMPLVATCDRWDIGGVSTELHPDTGRCTVVVYDGHPGGAGFADRGFEAARVWWTAARDHISTCECESGCPSCVQSPKCGNGNEPLDKHGAVLLLDALLASSPSATG
jgi:DEAD/DEAH box helicase domain-containing protein